MASVIGEGHYIDVRSIGDVLGGVDLCKGRWGFVRGVWDV